MSAREPLAAQCPKSTHPEGRHAWRFDGDDPYVVCLLCGERRDALTGRMLRIDPREASHDGVYGDWRDRGFPGA